MTFSPILTSKTLHRRSEAAVMHAEWSCAAARFTRGLAKKKGGGVRGTRGEKKVVCPGLCSAAQMFSDHAAERTGPALKMEHMCVYVRGGPRPLD